MNVIGSSLNGRRALVLCAALALSVSSASVAHDKRAVAAKNRKAKEER